jgi:hypothetical protein
MAEIPRNNTGLSGEYFVAAELYRRGWSVGMTIGNAKAVDLFAEKENIVVQVQVKSIYKKKNVGWPIRKGGIKKDCVYIFVNLNADRMSFPEYFICTSEEAYKKIKEYTSRGIIDLNSINTEDYKDRWDKLLKKAYVNKKLIKAS